MAIDDVTTSVQVEHQTVEAEKTSLGLDQNVTAALAYLFGVLSGIVVFLVEKEDEFVRFHAAQSIAVFGGLFVLSVGVGFLNLFLGLVIGGLLGGLLSLLFTLVWFATLFAGFVLWAYLLFKSYSGETPRIPIAAGIADSLVH
ncbi:DUF4870 domain-containing protein [Haloarchaeobius sp. TZWWS8]|uniref:DUF4870 domain-containing protein n=1 Tax=Haloarchaeobius sp. TZWWS8 TaxID=3446121 RepID=UPI003EB9F80D